MSVLARCIGRLFAFEATTFAGAIAREKHKDSTTELSTVPMLEKNGARMWIQYLYTLVVDALRNAMGFGVGVGVGVCGWGWGSSSVSLCLHCYLPCGLGLGVWGLGLGHA